MGTLKSTLALALMIGLLVSLFAVSSAQATDAIGRITSDTTWTKAQSRITLTGPLNVNNGVTLTIEPGVSVNLNGYYIQVEGTLRSIGTNTEQVTFNNGKINFMENSNGWNPQTNTGSIIQKSRFTGVTINAYPARAVKFNQNTLNGDLTVSGTSIVTSNTVVGTISVDGSAIVWKNTVQGSIASSGFEATLQQHPIISCNTVTGGAGYINSGIVAVSYVTIEDNTVSNCNYGISISTGRDVMGGCVTANAVIERNKISGCTHGIHAEIYNAMATTSGTSYVESNTLSNNAIAVYVDGWSQCLIFKGNNIEESSQYRVYLKGNDFNASQNWWGTTDTAAIKQSIYDSSRDFNLGTVTFEPLLSAENAEAYPNPNAEMPTAQTTASPTPNQSIKPTPTQTDVPTTTNPTDEPTTMPTHHSNEGLIPGGFDLEVYIFAALIIVIVLLAILIVVVLKRSKPK